LDGDLDVLPAGQRAREGPTESALDPNRASANSVKSSYLPASQRPTQIGPLGIRYDFNQGARVFLLARAEGAWRVRLRDLDTWQHTVSVGQSRRARLFGQALLCPFQDRDLGRRQERRGDAGAQPHLRSARQGRAACGKRGSVRRGATSPSRICGLETAWRRLPARRGQ
jgi:hypothetical protein